MSKNSGYTGLAFSYAQMLKEIQWMKSLADEFLAAEHRGVLQQCHDELTSIRGSRTDRVQYWEIREEWPIKTRVSGGEYRASGKDSGRPVFGTLSFRWGVKNVDKSVKSQASFYLVEEATTSIQVFDEETSRVVARWQIEVGDANSPGCHFHSSMTERQYKMSSDDGSAEEFDESNQTETHEPLFPEWLKVPRLPSLLVTPMDGLEFLLGELFQIEWNRSISRDSFNMSSWANSQGERLARLLTWKLKQIGEPDTTPWMALKKAKPEPYVFVD